MTDTATASGPTKKPYTKGQHKYNWALIQTLYSQGEPSQAIADSLVDPTKDRITNKRLHDAIRKRASHGNWRKKAPDMAQLLKETPDTANHSTMTQDKPGSPDIQTHQTQQQNALKPILGASTASQDLTLIKNSLERQKKSYLESGATLASHVLSRYSKQASDGTLPSDVEALRAIGDAVTPFHKIARDVFGLTQVAPAQVNIQVNSLSDCRLDTDVVDVE